MKHTTLMRALVSSGALTLSLGGAAYAAPCRPANPCAPRTGSSRMNPCAAKNPCAATNPCAAAMVKMDIKGVMRPANYRPYRGKQADLIARGKQLFGDTALSSNGLSCNTCHNNNNNGAFQDSFAQPYPHRVQMTHERANVKAVHLDEMVQFCMVVPMAAKPLPWSGKDLAALTAYTASLQKGFMAGVNPCAAKNPCAARNPCAAANPCAPQRH
ncbi:MAG: cytochrome C peroxidase [Gammaproteobacteria bacterium]|nr:cytochrome C peroxidase [Gammaproteobacteria bacterium]MBU1776306.1 cytochrome C peroxidase [Gammaproteobacteria bacterium]MBU1969397.1 cytochrome C peroxidase [Gammaproteobacteria bacterium]